MYKVSRSVRVRVSLLHLLVSRQTTKQPMHFDQFKRSGLYDLIKTMNFIILSISKSDLKLFGLRY